VTEARRTLGSVHNAARLLKSFSSLERELGVTELAQRLGLGKSTVHRLLATLAEEQLIEQDPVSGRYRLGLAVHELGAAASTATDLHAAVLAPMSVLRSRTGETVQIAVLDGREVVYVERLESPNTLRLFIEVGRRNDAHSTGTGKCLLAYLDDASLDRLLTGWELTAKTDWTITDQRALRDELAQIRRKGYATNLHESEAGVVSVAAPIRDARNRVIASMSVAGPAVRMEPVLERTAQAVIEACAVASRRLGWARGSSVAS
jgi:IclR family transcriptional regulator, KDG regulon repressor